MLVIAMETGSGPDGHVRWAGSRHDDDRPDASSGVSPSCSAWKTASNSSAGEQVALGFDCPLTMPVSSEQDPGSAPADADADALVTLAEPASSRPGLAELGYLLSELGTWRPWTTVSTSLARWKANTSILVWQAVPAPGASAVTASAAAASFFRQLPAVTSRANEPAAATKPAAATVVNLAAAAARRAGLFVDPSELAQPAVSITVTAG